MRFSILLASVLVAGSLSAHAGTPQQADGIRRSYEADFKAWVLKLHVAGSDAERKKVAQERPDATAAAKRMWAAIQPNLAEPWTVEPAAWLLKISAGLVAQGENGMIVDDVPGAALCAATLLRNSGPRERLAAAAAATDVSAWSPERSYPSVQAAYRYAAKKAGIEMLDMPESRAPIRLAI